MLRIPNKMLKEKKLLCFELVLEVLVLLIMPIPFFECFVEGDTIDSDPTNVKYVVYFL